MENKNVDLGSISLLIPQSKSGVKQAREELFTELKGYLDIVADRNLGIGARQKVGASDIVQSSFIRIIENFEDFRGETSAELKAWIKTIVKNEIHRVNRTYSTEKRDTKREVSISPKKDDSFATANSPVPIDDEATPSSGALKNEQRRRVHDILSQMKPEQAEVIRLRNIESLSYREIGKKMDRSEKSASQLWYRAMVNFEKKLRDSEGFAEE